MQLTAAIPILEEEDEEIVTVDDEENELSDDEAERDRMRRKLC